MFLQNIEAAPQLESLAAVDAKKLGSAVDVKNLGACNYVTKGAFYNVGGIVDGDQSNTQQPFSAITSYGTYSFNFCEANLATVPAGCDAGDFFAYYQDQSGTC